MELYGHILSVGCLWQTSVSSLGSEHSSINKYIYCLFFDKSPIGSCFLHLCVKLQYNFGAFILKTTEGKQMQLPCLCVGIDVWESDIEYIEYRVFNKTWTSEYLLTEVRGITAYLERTAVFKEPPQKNNNLQKILVLNVYLPSCIFSGPRLSSLKKIKLTTFFF